MNSLKKIFIFVIAGLVLLIAACGSDDPGYGDNEYNSEAYIQTEVTPVLTPMPDATPLPAWTPPMLPFPGGPPAGSSGVQEYIVTTEPVSYLPIPADLFELPITRRTISAGLNVSAAITEDGDMFVWGGFRTPDRWWFISYIMWSADNETLFLLDADGNEFKHYGMSGDGRNFYLICYYTSRRHNINTLDIQDEAGNPFTFDDFVQMQVYAMYFLLNPRQMAENAVSVRAVSDVWGTHIINEDGALVFFGGYRLDEDGEIYRSDDILYENVADFVAGRHSLHYGMIWTQFVYVDYGVLQTDGTFYFITAAGGTRRLFDANIIALEYGTGHMLFLAYNGQLWARGSGAAVGVLHHQSTFPPALVMENVAHIAVSDRHSMAVTKDGRLYAWGRNVQGQLGNGSRHPQNLPVFIMDNVIAIAAGDEHSMAITADGVLWGWGCNRFGQVGYGSDALHTRPVQVMGDVAAVSAGYGHTLALTSDGTLWAWGNNINGQLGDGTRENRAEPVQVMTGVMLP